MRKGDKTGVFFFLLSLPLLILAPPSRLSTTPLVDVSISPQPSSALRIQDSDHTFREEIISIRSPKIPLHCRLKYHGLPLGYGRVQEKSNNLIEQSIEK